MPKYYIEDNEVAILFYAYLHSKGLKDVSEEERFDLAVKAARKILEPALSYYKTQPEIAARHYAKVYREGKDISDTIEGLIRVSEQEPINGEENRPLLAYDTLAYMSSLLRLGPRPIPDALSDFAHDVLEDTSKDETDKKRPRPTKRGRRIDTNLARDYGLCYTYDQMLHWGYIKFRIEKKDKDHDEDEKHCSYRGASTIDIVGCAYEQETGEKFTYSRLEQIILSNYWRNNVLDKLKWFESLAAD